MQFESREALINYEKEREEYFRNWHAISNKNLFEFYKLMFLETFHPKYRSIKKKYENYNGGWYRREDGVIFTRFISLIDIKELKDGDVCCELESHYNENNIRSVYLYHRDMLIRM